MEVTLASKSTVEATINKTSNQDEDDIYLGPPVGGLTLGFGCSGGKFNNNNNNNNHASFNNNNSNSNLNSNNSNSNNNHHQFHRSNSPLTNSSSSSSFVFSNNNVYQTSEQVFVESQFSYNHNNNNNNSNSNSNLNTNNNNNNHPNNRSSPSSFHKQDRSNSPVGFVGVGSGRSSPQQNRHQQQQQYHNNNQNQNQNQNGNSRSFHSKSPSEPRRRHYEKNFLKKFQYRFVEIPADFDKLYEEFPELKPRHEVYQQRSNHHNRENNNNNHHRGENNSNKKFSPLRPADILPPTNEINQPNSTSFLQTPTPPNASSLNTSNSSTSSSELESITNNNNNNNNNNSSSNNTTPTSQKSNPSSPFSNNTTNNNSNTTNNNTNNNSNNTMSFSTTDLKRAKNPWVSIPLSSNEQFLRTLKGTLNRLTVENYDSLSEKVCELFQKIRDPESHRLAVGIVFDKAVSEPKFSKMYVQLCHVLNDLDPHFAPQHQQHQQPGLFRKVLLERCQQEFQNVAAASAAMAAATNNNSKQDQSTSTSTSTSTSPSSVSPPTDPEERSLFEEKLRRRKLGNVKLIGELFAVKLLSARIVHDCIKNLIEEILKNREKDVNTAENSSELLVRLLQTTGKLIDIPEASNWINAYFKQFTKFSEDTTLSLRIRFMFRDLIDLRRGHWIPRREESGPKTISEVHNEAFAHDLEEKFLSEDVVLPPKGSLPVSSNNNSTTPPKNSSGSKQTTPTTTPNQNIPQKKKNNKQNNNSNSNQNTPAQSSSPLSQSPINSQQPPQQPSYLVNASLISDSAHDDAVVQDWVDEFFALNDMDRLSAHVTKAKSEMIAKLIELSVLASLEKVESDREQIERMISQFARHGLFAEKDFVAGFKPIVDQIGDLRLDSPLVDRYLNKYLSAAISAGILSQATAKSFLNALVR